MTVLLLSFQFGCPLFLLVWLLCLGFPVPCWIREVSRHPCLVPTLKGNTCSFCRLSMMLAVGLSNLKSHLFHSFPVLKLWSRDQLHGGFKCVMSYQVWDEEFVWVIIYQFINSHHMCCRGEVTRRSHKVKTHYSCLSSVCPGENTCKLNTLENWNIFSWLNAKRSGVWLLQYLTAHFDGQVIRVSSGIPYRKPSQQPRVPN